MLDMNTRNPPALSRSTSARTSAANHHLNNLKRNTTYTIKCFSRDTTAPPPSNAAAPSSIEPGVMYLSAPRVGTANGAAVTYVVRMRWRRLAVFVPCINDYEY